MSWQPDDSFNGGIEAFEVIYKITDMDLLGFVSLNREVKSRHVKELRKSMDELDLSVQQPATIVPADCIDLENTEVRDYLGQSHPGAKFIVVDGQHRCFARLSRLARDQQPLSLYVTVAADVDGTRAMRVLNMVKSNWGNADHLNYVSEMPETDTPEEVAAQVVARKIRCLCDESGEDRERWGYFTEAPSWISPHAAMALMGVSSKQLQRFDVATVRSDEEVLKLIEEIDTLVALLPDRLKTIRNQRSIQAYVMLRQFEDFDFNTLRHALRTEIRYNKYYQRIGLVTTTSSAPIDRLAGMWVAYNTYAVRSKDAIALDLPPKSLYRRTLHFTQLVRSVCNEHGINEESVL